MTDFPADLIEGHYFFGQSGPSDKAGHAPHHAAGLVLYDDGSAGRAQGLASFQSILTHARQDYAQGSGAVNFRDGAKQNVNRGSAKILAGSLVSAEVNAASVFLHDHVIVPRSDPNAPRFDQITRFALSDRHGTLGGKSIGEERGEDRRHVLSNDYRQRELR